MRQWLRRMAALVGRRRIDRDLDEELRFHREMKQQAFEDEGLPPDRAREAAVRAVGGSTLRLRERAREVWVAPSLDAMVQDLRHAVRLLRRHPGFALTAIATIALGIGLNTAIFSMVYGVLIKPLRYRDPARLIVPLPVQADSRSGERVGLTWQGPEYGALAESNQTLDGLAAVTALNRQLSGQGEPEQLWGLEVSANFLDVMGVAPALGHGFVQGDAAANAVNARSVVIGDGLWRRAFGADPQVIGRVVTLDGEPRTIIGVLPAGFSFRLPIAMPYGIDLLATTTKWVPNNSYLILIGRLRPGVTTEQVAADLSAIRQGYAKTLAEPRGTQGTEVRSTRVVDLQTQMVGVDARRLLLVLAGAVLLVLLIVAVNIANLQLARWSSRRVELSLRMALGAGRRRIIGQLLTESLVLALAGGVLGVAIAYLAVPLLLAALPPGQLPRLDEIHVNTPVLAFSLLLAVGSGVLFGLLPALRHASSASTDDLRGGGTGGRAVTSGRQTERLRGLLVIGQVALTLVLLISAGLLMHSLLRLLAVPPGFDIDNVLTMTLVLPERQFATAAQSAAFTRDVLDRLAHMPNASATSSVSMVPLGIFSIRGTFEAEGQTPMPPRFFVSKPKIAPNYFRTLGIPLLAGRDFQASDIAGAPRVAIVSESVARRLWPDGTALGKRVRLDGPDWSTIVGIVGDVHQNHLQDPVQPVIYLPYTQESQRILLQFVNFVARTTTPEASAAFMRQAVREAAPTLPVTAVKTMQTLRSEVIAEPRTRTALLGGFALCALTIACLGIYGVMTYNVTQRRREIGIRLAIGAEGRDVIWLVLRRALTMVATGAIVGLAASFAVTNTLASFLFEIQPHDTLTIATVTSLLAIVAMTAAWLPARQAARTDPVDALRRE